MNDYDFVEGGMSVVFNMHEDVNNVSYRFRAHGCILQLDTTSDMDRVLNSTICHRSKVVFVTSEDNPMTTAEIAEIERFGVEVSNWGFFQELYLTEDFKGSIRIVMGIWQKKSGG